MAFIVLSESEDVEAEINIAERDFIADWCVRFVLRLIPGGGNVDALKLLDVLAMTALEGNTTILTM